MSSFGLINIGQQGLKAYQSALSVTGQNITNVNTPGYSRQVVDFESRVSSQNTFGVDVAGVRRIADGFITQQLWSDTSAFNFHNTLSFNTDQVDNLLADPQTGLSTAMDSFFASLQTAVDDPTSLPARQLLLSQTDALSRRFGTLDSQLQSQFDRVNKELTALTTTVTELAANVADLNNKIQISLGDKGQANELLDQREELVRQMAEFLDIRVVEDNGQMLNIFAGNGQQLVVGTVANRLTTVPGFPDESALGVALDNGAQAIDFSQDLAGGKMGGLLSYRDDVLVPAFNELGRLALAFTDALNQQHQAGMDLNGDLGGLLFNDINQGQTQTYAIQVGSNSVSTVPSLEVVDQTALVNTGYSISFSSGAVSVTRTGDSSTALGPVTYSAGMTLSFDGLEVNLDAHATVAAGSNPTFADGDTFSITTRAPSSTTRILPDDGNSTTGNVWLEIDDPSALQASDYLVQFTSSSSFTVTRLSDNTKTNFDYPQDHAFMLDGMAVTLDMPTTGNNPPVPGTDIANYQTGDRFFLQPTRGAGGDVDVALASTRQLALASPVRAETPLDNSGTGVIRGVTVTNASDPIFIAESGQLTLPNQNDASVPGKLEIVFNAPSVPGGDLTYSVYDVSNPNDPVALDLGSGALVNQPYSAPQTIDLRGFEISVSGQPDPGDRFSFEYNAEGTSDNRNALALSDLQQALSIGNTTFQDAYAIMIENVGTQANVARINRDANEAIVLKTTELRNSVSGVNLDEEAAKLIQFEQAYNASAQVISVARTLFDTLLNTVR